MVGCYSYNPFIDEINPVSGRNLFNTFQYPGTDEVDPPSGNQQDRESEKEKKINVDPDRHACLFHSADCIEDMFWECITTTVEEMI